MAREIGTNMSETECALIDTADGFLGDLLYFRDYVFALDQLTRQHRPIFDAFVRPDFRFASGEDLQWYFRDLQEHFSRLVDMLSSRKDTVNGAFDIYVSHVSHDANQVMKVPTLATVLLALGTIIIALFSMNVQGVPDYWPWSYLLMLCLVAVTSGMRPPVFHCSGWL